MKDACPFSIFLVTVFFLDVISSVHYRDFVVSVRPKLRSMFSRTRFVNNKDVIPFVRFLKKFDELNSSRDIWLFVSKFFIINLRLRSGNLIYPRKTRKWLNPSRFFSRLFAGSIDLDWTEMFRFRLQAWTSTENAKSKARNPKLETIQNYKFKCSKPRFQLLSFGIRICFG